MARGRSRRILAVARKEVLQLKQDHRTLGLMLIIPIIWLVLFGYAATFDVSEFSTSVVNQTDRELPDAIIETLIDEGFDPIEYRDSVADAQDDMLAGRAQVVIVLSENGGIPGSLEAHVLIDGSELVAAQGAIRSIQQVAQNLREDISVSPPVVPSPPPTGLSSGQGPTIVPQVQIEYNPDLKSADFMIPGLIGMIVLFVGGMMTSLGLVREREKGTLDQLVATPIRSSELIIGKILPYTVVVFIDLAVIVLLALYVFGVPFEGSIFVLVLASTFFLLTALGVGLLISSISNNQQQAMQTSVFYMFPQFLLSGLIFPLAAIPAAIRWISYLLPLTYFVPIARGVFLKGTGIDVLWPYILALGIFTILVLTLASIRFRTGRV